MSTLNTLQCELQPLGIGLAGSWTLPSARAITLGAATGGFLQVSQGSVWATFQGPHQGPANDWGDLVLRCGTRIHLMPGQQVVLEPYQRAANEATCFHWEPDARPPVPYASGPRAHWRRVGTVLARLGRAVGQWVAPGPTWPVNDPAQEFERATLAAWRNLYHLRINPP